MLVTFYVKTGIGGSTYYSTLQKTLKIVNATPTISVTATPTDYSSLTGSETTLIKGISNVNISVTATPLKNAYIKSITSGGTTLLSGNTATGVITKTGTIEKVTSNIIETIATDSRNLSSAKDTKEFPIIDYVELSINATVSRPSPTSSIINAIITGNYFNQSFGSAINTLSITWQYKLQKETDYTNGGTLTATKSGDTYSVTAELGSDFAYNQDYDFRFTATDELMTRSTDIPLGRGIPYYDYGVDANGNDYFWTNGDFYTEGKKLVDLIYPVGSIYMSMNLIDPATLFGGTWERMSGGFLYGAVNTADTGNGTGTKTGAATGNTGSTALTISQIPSHTHSFTAVQRDTNATTLASGSYGYVSSGSTTGATGGGAGHTHTLNSHTHVVPYMSVFTWKRTA